MKRQQLFGIFKRDKDGNILGYVEHSFHMSWNVFFVRRWTKRELKSLSLDPDFRKPGVFFLRLTRTKHKDIKIDWQTYWSQASKNGCRNFDWRNVPFKQVN